MVKGNQFDPHPSIKLKVGAVLSKTPTGMIAAGKNIKTNT
jgi:hypothetical protein